MKRLFFLFVLFFLFAFTGEWKLVTGDLAFADEITLRAIVTPIGSQTEKWGAVGMMVCVAGKPISEGGCGTEDTTVKGFDKDGKETAVIIEQEDCTLITGRGKDCDKLVFFVDELKTPDGKNKGDHQFTGDNDKIFPHPAKKYWDTVYAVRGAEQEEVCPSGMKMRTVICIDDEDQGPAGSGDAVADCTSRGGFLCVPHFPEGCSIRRWSCVDELGRRRHVLSKCGGGGNDGYDGVGRCAASKPPCIFPYRCCRECPAPGCE